MTGKFGHHPVIIMRTAALASENVSKNGRQSSYLDNDKDTFSFQLVVGETKNDPSLSHKSAELQRRNL
jgi:hypothetical protein